jgi:hypothetical protein
VDASFFILYHFMQRSILIYFFLITITIVFGLFSRHYTSVPLFIGDILWATMVYFIVRFLFITKSLPFAILASLLFCFAIEFSQLYKAPWINDLRHTLFGRLILGDTFLWSDLLCYVVGIMTGWLIDKYLILKINK